MQFWNVPPVPAPPRHSPETYPFRNVNPTRIVECVALLSIDSQRTVHGATPPPSIIVLPAPDVLRIVIALFSVVIGAYVPGATRIVSPADEASIAACIVALADDWLVPELESEPVEPFTYQVAANAIIGISTNATINFLTIALFPFAASLGAHSGGKTYAPVSGFRHRGGGGNKMTPPPMHQVRCVGLTFGETPKEAKLHARQCLLDASPDSSFLRFHLTLSQTRWRLRLLAAHPRG